MGAQDFLLLFMFVLANLGIIAATIAAVLAIDRKYEEAKRRGRNEHEQ